MRGKGKKKKKKGKMRENIKHTIEPLLSLRRERKKEGRGGR